MLKNTVYVCVCEWVFVNTCTYLFAAEKGCKMRGRMQGDGKKE